MARRKRASGIPAVTGVKDPNVERILTAMRERLMNINSSIDVNALGRMMQNSGAFPGSGQGDFLGGDTTPGIRPNAPENLSADGMFGGVFLEVDQLPVHAAYIEWYAAPDDNLSHAQVVGQSPAPMFFHYTGDDTLRYYWCKAVGYGDPGLRSEFNKTKGVSARSARDVQFLLDKLNKSISNDELTSAITDEVEKISGNGTGSVNKRISASASSIKATMRSEFQDADSDLESLIQQKYETKTDANSARSSLQTTLQSSINSTDQHVASVQNTASTNASAIDGLSAQEVFKVDANGVVAGIGLASGPTGASGVTRSRIYLAANRIALLTTDSQSKSKAKPIAVAQGNDLFINSAMIGKEQVVRSMIKDAAINAAKIKNASIIAAKIANSAVTNAKIKNAAITAAKIKDASIGSAKLAGTIQSDNFSAGSKGWRIKRNGDAEFNDLKSRNLKASGNTLLESGGITDFGYNLPGVDLRRICYFIESSPINITAWKGSIDNYIAKGYLTGPGSAGSEVVADTDKPPNVYWGVTIKLLPLTKWSGNQTLRMLVTIYTRNARKIKHRGGNSSYLHWEIYKDS